MCRYPYIQRAFMKKSELYLNPILDYKTDNSIVKLRAISKNTLITSTLRDCFTCSNPGFPVASFQKHAPFSHFFNDH